MSVASATNQARKILAENFILEPPVDVYELARNYGIEIHEQHFPLEFANVSGFINIEKGRPVMYVNASEPAARRKFTVAHELGHWIMHEDKIRQDPQKAILFRMAIGAANKDPLEREANAFAAELLVPMEMLEKNKDKSISQLADIFQVSSDVIGFRKVSAENVAKSKAVSPKPKKK